jgi:hypothetical protein
MNMGKLRNLSQVKTTGGASIMSTKGNEWPTTLQLIGEHRSEPKKIIFHPLNLTTMNSYISHPVATK